MAMGSHRVCCQVTTIFTVQEGVPVHRRREPGWHMEFKDPPARKLSRSQEQPSASVSSKIKTKNKTKKTQQESSYVLDSCEN